MRAQWLHLLIPLAGALLLLEIARRIAKRHDRTHRWGAVGPVVRRCALPVWAVTALVVLEIWLPRRFDSSDTRSEIRHWLGIALIAALTWLVVEIVYAATDIALHRLTRALGTRDNRRARRARTQLIVIRRVLAAIAVVIATGAILLTFGQVRALGASFLASAGLVGAVAGIAARSTLGNIIAGLQIAFSDMLRMDDVVVVESEWGRIDDITLTYVVVRTWDERRIILPTSYFVDNPFQNWTREESRVMGTVLLEMDFTVPVEEIRAQTQRIIEDSPLWDRREWVLQVTDLTAQGVQLRILVSAADAPSAWDLRCDIREQLLTFIRERYPLALPRGRVESVSPKTPPLVSADPYPGDSPADADAGAGDDADQATPSDQQADSDG
jgi:small-conductance mechanosensitive channel